MNWMPCCGFIQRILGFIGFWFGASEHVRRALLCEMLSNSWMLHEIAPSRECVLALAWAGFLVVMLLCYQVECALER